MPEQSEQYVLGWNHGHEAAILGQRPQRPDPDKLTKVLAAGTFLAGIGSAVAFVIYQTDSPWKDVFAVLAVSGLLLSGTLGAVRVLQGEPTPNLGLKA